MRDLAQAHCELGMLAIELTEDARVGVDTALDEPGKQDVLLFGVVAALGEQLEEIDDLTDFGVPVLAGVAHVAHLLFGYLVTSMTNACSLARMSVGRMAAPFARETKFCIIPVFPVRATVDPVN